MRVSLTIDLAPLKAEAKTKIDAAAEAVRSHYITPGAGQAMTYQAKAAEAVACLAGGAGPFPILTAEAAARDVSVPDLAAAVMAAAEAWTALAAEIEARRIGAKRAVEAAATPAAIAAILATVEA